MKLQRIKYDKRDRYYWMESSVFVEYSYHYNIFGYRNIFPRNLSGFSSVKVCKSERAFRRHLRKLSVFVVSKRLFVLTTRWCNRGYVVGYIK